MIQTWSLCWYPSFGWLIVRWCENENINQKWRERDLLYLSHGIRVTWGSVAFTSLFRCRPTRKQSAPPLSTLHKRVVTGLCYYQSLLLDRIELVSLTGFHCAVASAFTADVFTGAGARSAFTKKISKALCVINLVERLQGNSGQEFDHRDA